MKLFIEELEEQKRKLQTLSIYTNEPNALKIIKQLQEQNKDMLANMIELTNTLNKIINKQS